MSDYYNLREDEYEHKLEASNEARDAAIDMHTENWMTAVTKSVEKSNGTFPDVREYAGRLFDLKYITRPANSADVFVSTLHNLDFLERAARILIDLHKIGERADVDELFNDMAASFAEYEYEKNRKD